jgi:phage terminase Nu1 subunit (DNA packaging protein)
MTTSKRNAAAELTKRAFAETFGVSEAQLERLFQQGMPHEKKSSRKVVIPMPSGRVWYHEYLVKKGEKRAAPSTIDEARLRKETAQAALEELKLAREQGVTMRVEEHEKLLGEAMMRVRAKLLNLGPRAAGAAFGATSLPECQAKIDPVVQEIMEELHQADDVPTFGDEDDMDQAELEEAARI